MRSHTYLYDDWNARVGYGDDGPQTPSGAVGADAELGLEVHASITDGAEEFKQMIGNGEAQWHGLVT